MTDDGLQKTESRNLEGRNSEGRNSESRNPEGSDALKKPDLTELELENQRLREENQRLKEYRASLPPKERIYDHIPLTVKQMDIIIGALLVLLVVVLVMGMMSR